jgi:RHH-type proline utilization regulon transcriptional repressor/proline dehydrogenase/delta 1-pyrroline-5-carboxylate dehydrogenase
MRYLANQFVLGETLPQALQHAAYGWRDGATHSFDMLGEAALTADDSERYWQAYRDAILAISRYQTPADIERPNVSIKLSALHPRFHAAHSERLQQELLPQLCTLAELAAAHAIDLTIDAEEADRLELSLQLFAQVLQCVAPSVRPHIGIVVQAYGKRAWAVLQWLDELASQFSLRINVRLVKGAYWDTEIKRAQQRGLADYPVFTDKTATDISYLACARWLLQRPQQFFPQFATHNAVTVAAIVQLQPDVTRFEFQRLQGMGEILYRIVREQYPALRQRIYAPVGEHRDLLPYLVRRLLENGANTSFMHQLHDTSIAVTTLAAHPLQHWTATKKLPLPADIWHGRRNSPGVYLYSERVRVDFFSALQPFRFKNYSAPAGDPELLHTVINPYTEQPIGTWQSTTPTELENALKLARQQQPHWQRMPVDQRVQLLEAYADLLLTHRAELVVLMVRETAKTIENAIDEVREAIDFCRYYAQQARALLQAPLPLPATVGEHNEIHYCARGIVVCISPWNFPLAIFSGQIAAALLTGNAVIAKPAEQSTLTAQFAIHLMHSAGIPANILHCAPGAGEIVGKYLCAHSDIDGIIFTGGWDTARSIQQQLALRNGAMIPFIAETAGINAMIADSSAQPQQLVNDILRSAFDSAGQRCSALRVLYLPENCADAIERLLCGAMNELQLGDPLDWATDIGPVIDGAAKTQLTNYLARYQASILFQLPTPSTGNFVAPTLIRLRHIKQIEREAFGPILHIIRYREDDIDNVIDDINALGYGLTCGIHSRNHHKAQWIAERLRVGNIYFNRDIVGAVVGAQPFGGCGKSGTGPKAGGPNYLLRFTSEKTITTNTAALGGDYTLLTK